LNTCCCCNCWISLHCCCIFWRSSGRSRNILWHVLLFCRVTLSKVFDDAVENLILWRDTYAISTPS
jgi:hypothetical protein